MSNNIINNVVVVIAFIFITFIVTILNGRIEIIKDDFKNPIFVVMFTVVVIFVIRNMIYGNYRIKRATESALIGMCIAYLAHLDLVISAFWLVFLLRYYLKIEEE